MRIQRNQISFLALTAAAFLAVSAGGARAVALAGEDRVRAVLTEALAPFRTEDGRYVMHNHFRLTVAERPR